MSGRQRTATRVDRQAGDDPLRVEQGDGGDRQFVATGRIKADGGEAGSGRRTERDDREPGERHTYLRLGRFAWATLGILGVLVVLGIIIGEVALLVVPLILALFPAALLMPVAKLLKRLKLPAAVASLLTILGFIAVIAGIFAALAPFVADELPDLIESVSEGVDELEQWLQGDPLGVGLEFDGFAGLIEQGREQIGDVGAELGAGLAGGAVTALGAAVEGVTALLLTIVALFFYLKDDGKLARGFIKTLPEGWRRDATAMGDRFWATTGNYFRGQLLVALFDAVFIGIGLLLLGIPLAIPLAVLVFFGGLFPIVGAIVTGAVAVLVALADAGPLMALAVAGLVLAVQQVESNVLEPLILAKVIRLHPLVVLASITAGAILLGVLGAFLSVPIAASIARAIDYVRGEEDEEDEEEHAEDPDELVGAED
jgi:putative heme transporter